MQHNVIQTTYLQQHRNSFDTEPRISFLLFLDRNLKVNIEQLTWTIERRFFPVVKGEINCCRDGSVETTKISLPCSTAVDPSVSWISRANAVPLSILLSRISPKFRSHGRTGSSKYGTTRKNTQRYYTTKRLIRYI